VFDELSLIRRVKRQGDRAAADELIRRYYDEIFRFAKRQTRDEQTALDVTQEIFIGFLRTIGGYDPRKANLRTWLYRVAANKLTDFYRARSREILAEPLGLSETEPIDERDFARQVADSEFAERVSGFVGGEPPDTQRIFRLHVWGEWTFAEIAESLDLPESTIKTKYYRLTAKLRKEFSDYGESG
jgi:RNA polymerase sigma-70 factor (ECF subfamily)